MAGLTVDIASELPKAIRWTDAMTRQLPFSVSQALNAVGFDARKALNGATKQYFDRPTPFVQRSFMVEKSNKRNLIATVYPERRRLPYIEKNIIGGRRGQKPFELKLQSLTTGSLPRGNALVPAVVRRNTYGNVGLATIKGIGGRVATSGVNSVFIGRPRGGNRAPGVYERRKNGKLRPLFISVPKPAYRQILPLTDIGTKVVERRFSTYLRQYLEQNVARG